MRNTLRADLFAFFWYSAVRIDLRGFGRIGARPRPSIVVRRGADATMTRAGVSKISAWVRRSRGAVGVLALCLASAPAAPAGAPEASPAWPLDALTAAIRPNADGEGFAPTLRTLESIADGVGRRLLLTTAPGWVPRPEFNWGMDADEHLWFRTRSVQPLYQAESDAAFADGRLVRSHQDGFDQTSASLGLGYRRRLANDRWLVGTDAFLDRGWPRPSERGSMGCEIGTTAFTLRSDLYLPLSDGEAGSPRAGRSSGYDLSLRMQLPYMPAVAATFEASSGVTGAVDGSAGKKRVGLSFRPTPFVSLAGEAAHGSGDAMSYTVMLRFAVKLYGSQRGSSLPLVDDRPFRFSSMRGRELDPVRPDGILRELRTAAR